MLNEQGKEDYGITIFSPGTPSGAKTRKLLFFIGLCAIILIQAFGAFGVFLMKQFYETIPEELSEAARLDGLS